MNEKIIILEEIPKEFYDKKIDEGTSAVCFLLNNGEVYKEFFCPELYADIIECLSNYSSNNILFPKKVVYVKDNGDKKFKGYISDFATGVYLSEIDKEININIFLEHLELLEKELFKYVTYGIIASDLNTKNLTYDKDKGFIIFDIGMFERTNEDNFSDMYRMVLSELNNTLVAELIEDFSCNKRDDIKEIVLNCMYYFRIRVSMMIKKIKEIYENEGYIINTIGDFQKLFEITPKL